MPDFDEAITDELNQLEHSSLRRSLRSIDSPQGIRIRSDEAELVNFSSNDYLGLANHPALIESGQKALVDFGVGAGSSRLICGNLPPHIELEEALADFKGTEAAITFATGYAAAIGAVCSILGKGDVVILDKLVHASLVDAARSSGAIIRVFRHNDLGGLEKRLKWANEKHPEARKLIVTESVFSMDGDLAPLLNIVELKERYGAWLMVDEAHATGLFGDGRSGLIQEFNLTDRVEIQMATLGKALGAAGGAICGSRQLIDLLINKARSLIYSTAPPPCSAAAAKAAITLVRSQEGESRRQQLWAMTENLKTTLIECGHAPGIVRSPIVPLIIGDEQETMSFAEHLREPGILVPGIRYPTVARGQARLRFTITADHNLDDLAILRQALQATLPTVDEA
ncbi:MAG: aminotransferase class I/II-fold pyridoxal phosphate-dependent enzyme [Limisphaerales bacterium]